MRLDRLEERFFANFSERNELGASVSVWKDGREILSLAHGWQNRECSRPWTQETPVLFWSATKGLAAGCVLHALQGAGRDPLTTRVAELWPEFGANGKAGITIGQLMSHQAGLSALSIPLSVWDYDGIIRALAAEAPHWPPGRGHGYHPRTFGFLMDELCRRTAGRTIRDYWRDEFVTPHGLELWLGVPEHKVSQVAPVFPSGTPPPPDDGFYREFLKAGTFTARSFSSPRGLHSAAALNQPEALTAGFPGFGGVGTARGLANYYSWLAECGAGFLPATIDWMSTTLAQGFDRVLHIETAFSCGFMRDPVGPDGRKSREHFGPSHRAFGHPGAGGSHAFADPENGIAFAYVMNQMEPGVLPGPRALAMVEALYS
jgi:CubicO group peptidase (beta-lactamase class C family)